MLSGQSAVTSQDYKLPSESKFINGKNSQGIASCEQPSSEGRHCCGDSVTDGRAICGESTRLESSRAPRRKNRVSKVTVLRCTLRKLAVSQELLYYKCEPTRSYLLSVFY